MSESQRRWFHAPAEPITASHAPPPVGSIADFLASVSLAPRQAHKLLTLWPLLRSEGEPDAGLAYCTLADAVECGALHVSERRGGASVPSIHVENQGELPVLVLFGEELRGALQNRIANASFLVPARSALEIDVSCVEQGRWGRREGRGARGAHFVAGKDVMSSAIRRKMAAKVALARERGLGFCADQSEVWDAIADRLRRSAVHSPTGAYEDYLDTRRRDLDEAARAFRPLPGQVGFVAAIGDEVVGLEAIGRAEVFARAFDGLLRAYLVDAVDAAQVRDGGGPAPGTDSDAPPARAARFDAPEPFLSALAAAPASESASLGLGLDVRVRGGGVAACALVSGAAAPGEPEAVVHLTAFVEEGA